MASSTKLPNLKDKVYSVVKVVPHGKVTTYGHISRKLQIPNSKFQVSAQMVGWMLHANKDPNVPCHRVVDRNGRLAPNFAGPGRRAFSAIGGPASGWDGAVEQRRRLEVEGVTFVDELHVDLSRSLWVGS